MNSYSKLEQLTDDERLEARQAAAAFVVKAVGEQPQRHSFDRVTVSKYPHWINNLILGLVVIVLIAAFVPSAIRLFSIGYSTFIQGVPVAAAAVAVGVAVVLMAETAQILFSVASVVLDTDAQSERLLNASMAAATVLALVGNGQVALPGHWTNPFAWLEALLPPLLVLSTAYILKQQLLTQIEMRHGNERAYQQALSDWQIAVSEPEQHPRYMQALANSMKAALKDKNSKGTGATARRELMASLRPSDWKALVMRELHAEQWYSAELNEDTEPIQPEVNEVPFLELASHNGNGVHHN